MMTFTKYYVSAANWLMILPLSSVYNFCLSRNEQYYELAHQYQGNSQVSFWFLEELSWFVQEKWEIQWTLTWINYLIIIIQIISKHSIILIIRRPWVRPILFFVLLLQHPLLWQEDSLLESKPHRRAIPELSRYFSRWSWKLSGTEILRSWL